LKLDSLADRQTRSRHSHVGANDWLIEREIESFVWSV
jgi:hypothetical protein